MDDELRASAVRKLRALADLLECGEDDAIGFYAYDPERGVALCGTHGARELAIEAIEICRPNGRDEIEWGIALPLEFCRDIHPLNPAQDRPAEFFALVDTREPC